MGLLDWFRSDAPQYRAVPLPGDRVAEADVHYVRVWLAEMTLADGRRLFDDYTPVVHAAVTFDVGGQRDTVSTVAGPPTLPGLTRIEGDVIHGRHALTGLIPYRGGHVEVGVGLAAYRRADSSVDALIDLLGDLSGLLKQPALGKLKKVSGPLIEGIQRLSGAGDKRLHLSYHDTFAGNAAAGGKPLRSGYVAVVRDQVDPQALSVEDDTLLRNDAPLRGVDAMLLAIEVAETRDDWRAFGAWNGLCNDAVDKALEGDDRAARAILGRALKAIRRSTDLTAPDRRRVVMGVQKRFQADTSGLGLAFSGSDSFLERAVAAAPSPAEARNMPD